MDINNWANEYSGFLLLVATSIAFFSLVFSFFKKLRTKLHVKNKVFFQKGGKNSTNIQGEDLTFNKYGNDK